MSCEIDEFLWVDMWEICKSDRLEGIVWWIRDRFGFLTYFIPVVCVFRFSNYQPCSPSASVRKSAKKEERGVGDKKKRTNRQKEFHQL
jgi:hypothetical protein